MNTTQLTQPVYELVQDLLAARSTLENVTISAQHVAGPDARVCLAAAQTAIAEIDRALDLIKYRE
jgi:hypothetical protein